MIRTRKRNAGTTLIEVLFAAFLAAMCGMVLAATMPVASKSRAKAEMNDKATSIAQRELEAVRGLGYANITASQLLAYGLIDSTTPTSGTTYSFTNVAKPDNEFVNQGGRVLLKNMQGAITIDQVDLDLRRVIVDVSYIDRGTTRTVRLSTLVANL